MSSAMPILSRQMPANTLPALARCAMARSQPRADNSASAGITGKMYPTSLELGMEKNAVMLTNQIQHKLHHALASTGACPAIGATGRRT